MTIREDLLKLKHPFTAAEAAVWTGHKYDSVRVTALTMHRDGLLVLKAKAKGPNGGRPANVYAKPPKITAKTAKDILSGLDASAGSDTSPITIYRGAEGYKEYKALRPSLWQTIKFIFGGK